VGLDSVEFVLATEEAFQIAIPDADAERLVTPGHVVDYVLTRVGGGADASCLEQRAFYRLRHASMRLFQAERAAIKPATRWDTVLPTRDTRHNWRLLHQATGTPQWPRLTLLGRLPAPVQTVGGTARYLATQATAALKGEARWTREEVQATVARLMKEQLGIKNFEWSQEFVRDLGVD
jgi:acyl carrier protein